MADHNIVIADVCRICWEELNEGDTLRLRCRCRGELALAHRECAAKWFAAKGDVTCEVCNHEVANLQIRRSAAPAPPPPAAAAPPPPYRFVRVLEDEPLLLFVSVLAYMAFLELFMLDEMGIRAITISLPFGCILGLLGSVISATIVGRRYVWILATVQFLLLVCLAIIFSYSKLHLTASLSLSLATIAGFGSGICGSGFIYLVLNQQHGETTTGIEQPQQQGGSVEAPILPQSSSTSGGPVDRQEGVVGQTYGRRYDMGEADPENVSIEGLRRTQSAPSNIISPPQSIAALDGSSSLGLEGLQLLDVRNSSSAGHGDDVDGITG